MIYKKYFQSFCDAMDKKMAKGYETFGDKSYDRDGLSLIKEIQEELVDVAGWAQVRWGQLEELKKKERRLESVTHQTKSWEY
jgi:hypothetical protein